MGRRRYDYPRCMRVEGCFRPMPELEPLDSLALLFFRKGRGYWVTQGDALTGVRRIALDLTQYEKLVNAHGYVLNEFLLDRLTLCQGWQLEKDEAARPPEPPLGRESRVN